MKKRNISRRKWALVMLALTGLAVTALAADVDGKFKLFGNAQWVTGGIQPHIQAIDLTSNCGAQAYSNTCYTSTPPFNFSGVAFTPKPSPSVTLADITTLSTAYNLFGATDCSGGSPRFVIFTSSHNFEANIGKAPFGGDCYFGWQNTGNWTTTTDPTLRWQVNVGNTFYSWSAILASHGTELVTEIDIVLDAGWIAPRGQDVTIDRFTVNDNVMSAGDEHDHH